MKNLKRIPLILLSLGAIASLSISSAPVIKPAQASVETATVKPDWLIFKEKKENSYVKPYATYPHIYHAPDNALLYENHENHPDVFKKLDDAKNAKYNREKRDRPSAPKGAKYFKMTLNERGNAYEVTKKIGDRTVSVGVWKEKGDPAKEIFIPYLENDTAYSVAKRYCQHLGYGTPKKSYDAVTNLNWSDEYDKKVNNDDLKTIYGPARFAIRAWDEFGAYPHLDEAECKMNNSRFG